MNQITILYFGQLKEESGVAEEIITTDSATVFDLYNNRATEHNMAFPAASLKFARNEVFCDANETVRNSDTIAFMPPMSGG